MTGVQTLQVAAEDADQRLDRWLRRLFPHLGQGRIEKMCRKGELRVDGGRVKASTRLEAGQSVRVPPLPDPGQTSASKPPQMPKITDQDAAMIQGCVIYRDDHIIALNKPAGLPTQGGAKQTRHVDGRAEAIAELASTALVQCPSRKEIRRLLPRALWPAVTEAFQTQAHLLQAAAQPGRVASGELSMHPLARSVSLWRWS